MGILMKRLGVALIGCGTIGKVHAMGFKTSRYVDLIIACDIIKEKVLKLVKEFGFKEYTTDYKEAIEKDNVQIVSIATPPKYHAEIALYALERGKHVVGEKPMATNLNDTLQMGKLAKENNLKLCIDYQNRFLPPYQETKRLIEKGCIGKILQIRARIAYHILEVLPPNSSMLKWLFEPQIAGGGVLFDVGSHWVDLMMWLCSKKVRKVFALLGNLDDKIPRTVEDSAILVCELEEGIQAIVDVSWAIKRSLPLVEVYGDKGAIIAGLPHRLMYYSESCEPIGKWTTIELPTGEEPHLLLIRRFIESINKNKEPPVTGIDGYCSLKVLMVAYESAKDGEVKNVEYQEIIP